jgi:hypothetical protein
MVATIAGIGYGLFTVGAAKAGMKTKKKKAFKAPVAASAKVDDWGVEAYTPTVKSQAVVSKRNKKPVSKK